MIIGIGTDMIEIHRIKKACQNSRFIERVYTELERTKYLTYVQKLAGNFAVKEAVVKVLGTGFGKIEPREIEVLRNEKGKPYVVLYGNAQEQQQQLGIQSFHVSITNTNEYAMAFVIGEG